MQSEILLSQEKYPFMRKRLFREKAKYFIAGLTIIAVAISINIILIFFAGGLSSEKILLLIIANILGWPVGLFSIWKAHLMWFVVVREDGIFLPFRGEDFLTPFTEIKKICINANNSLPYIEMYTKNEGEYEIDKADIWDLEEFKSVIEKKVKVVYGKSDKDKEKFYHQNSLKGM